MSSPTTKPNFRWARGRCRSSEGPLVLSLFPADRLFFVNLALRYSQRSGSMNRGMQNSRACPSSPALRAIARAARSGRRCSSSRCFSRVRCDLADLPAALLIGPMLAAIVAGTNGATVRVPPLGFAGAQAIVGCLIAGIDLAGDLLGLPRRLAAVHRRCRGDACGVELPWLVHQPLQGAAGHDGRLGFGAGRGDGHGSDGGRLRGGCAAVAFMQYLRVILVSLAAALIARFWVETSGVEAAAADLVSRR